jgi:ribosomal protein L4
MQNAAAWPESELQELVAAEWRTQCRQGTEPPPAEGECSSAVSIGVDAQGMAGQARMLKVVRLLQSLCAATPAGSVEHCQRVRTMMIAMH